MTHAELSRELRALGWVLKRQGKGSHEIPTGTLRAILKQLGIQREDLDSL